MEAYVHNINTLDVIPPAMPLLRIRHLTERPRHREVTTTTGMGYLHYIVMCRRRRLAVHILRLSRYRIIHLAIQWVPKGGIKTKEGRQILAQDILRRSGRNGRKSKSRVLPIKSIFPSLAV